MIIVLKAKGVRHIAHLEHLDGVIGTGRTLCIPYRDGSDAEEYLVPDAARAVSRIVQAAVAGDEVVEVIMQEVGP